MDYDSTVNYIDSLAPTLERPTLERIEKFLRNEGNPQNLAPAFHVAGTNGKGSTVAMIDSILRESGFKTGRFTGPHLLRWNERFHVEGVPISDDDFARLGTIVKELSDQFGLDNPELGALTWFEYITAIAFFYFRERQVEVLVIEVGLGGRFDATNVFAKPTCTGITNIALDHMHILGDTIEQIAFEKAGIIKPDIPVVTGATGSALSVIEKRAKEVGAPLIKANDLDLSEFAKVLSGRGSYQIENAKVAVTMLHEANRVQALGLRQIDKEAIRRGLKHYYWPARLQYIKERGIVLDGAHNVAGAKALQESIRSMFPNRPMQFVFGCYGNKNGSGMLAELLKPGDFVHLAEATSKRATFDREVLAQTVSSLGISYSLHDSISKALSCALAERKHHDDPVIVTGSFATVREACHSLGWTRVEDGVD
jgi:dihydrofolate synthase / folylpolyglutamate synthase